MADMAVTDQIGKARSNIPSSRSLCGIFNVTRCRPSAKSPCRCSRVRLKRLDLRGRANVAHGEDRDLKRIANIRFDDQLFSISLTFALALAKSSLPVKRSLSAAMTRPMSFMPSAFIS